MAYGVWFDPGHMLYAMRSSRRLQRRQHPMPTLDCRLLEVLARDIFQAIKVPPAGAAWMAQLLVRANLRGHDSHGVIRVPQYVASWRKGEANPTAEPVVVQDGPATALLDGKLGGA